MLLIVNTATSCSFTPQYEDLQRIYDQYHTKGFEILDFPCNQFGSQAKGENEVIHEYCVGRFGISFPQFAKIDVLGENQIPLYKWISENTKFGGFKGPAKLVLSVVAKKNDKEYESNGNIKWNFTKILCDRQGNIIRRFEPTDPIDDIEEELKKIL